MTLNISAISGTTTIGLHIANRVTGHLSLRMANLCYSEHQGHILGKVKTDFKSPALLGFNLNLNSV